MTDMDNVGPIKFPRVLWSLMLQLSCFNIFQTKASIIQIILYQIEWNTLSVLITHNARWVMLVIYTRHWPIIIVCNDTGHHLMIFPFIIVLTIYPSSEGLLTECYSYIALVEITMTSAIGDDCSLVLLIFLKGHLSVLTAAGPHDMAAQIDHFFPIRMGGMVSNNM